MSFKFEDCKNGLILGSTGGIGSAIFNELSRYSNLNIITHKRQSNELLDEDWWEDFSNSLPTLDFVINCIGTLSGESGPEKSSRSIKLEEMKHVFNTNSFIPALSFKFLKKKINRKEASLFVNLSAKVGSIDDNNLGGWYSYRSSKAALNMMTKNFHLETKTQFPNLVVLAQHPGTTLTNMTKNHIQNVKYKVKEPLETAKILINLWESLGKTSSGKFLNWDGEEIKW